jgi:hypothetical protein
MNNNEEQLPKLYPEQENPPRPTYEATIRGVHVGGWLYYRANAISVVVTADGERVTGGYFSFNGDDERKMARLKAKNTWRNVVLAVLGGV